MIFVGDEGIGPSTSVLSGQRSATELIAHLIKFILIFLVILVNSSPLVILYSQ